MAIDRRILELALKGLEAERDRIASEIDELRARLGSAAKTAKRTTRRVRKKARKMTAAQRRAISKKMKAVWAERKKARR